MMTPQERKDLALNEVQLALDQLSRVCHIAMNIVMTFAKLTPRKIIQPKLSNPNDLKKIIRYRKHFNKLSTINGQLRATVLKQVNK